MSLFDPIFVFVDPDPYWIRIHELFGSGSGSVLRIRIRIHKAPKYGSNTDPDPQHWLMDPLHLDTDPDPSYNFIKFESRFETHRFAETAKVNHFVRPRSLFFELKQIF